MDPAEIALRRRAKALMRRRAAAFRMRMPAKGLRARCEKLCEQLLALPEIAAAQSVALFWPIERKKEVDLRALDAALRERGVRVAYPAMAGQGNPMTMRWVDDISTLEERGQGFAEPAADAPEAEALDVVVVPGLLFDPRGHRIGYGGGYYDRTLPRFRPPAFAVGAAFDFQLGADLPTDAEDVALDAVVTDAQTFRI